LVKRRSCLCLPVPARQTGDVRHITAVFEDATRRKAAILCPQNVLTEFVYVLEKIYRHPKPQIREMISDFIAFLWTANPSSLCSNKPPPSAAPTPSSGVPNVNLASPSWSKAGQRPVEDFSEDFRAHSRRAVRDKPDQSLGKTPRLGKTCIAVKPNVAPRLSLQAVKRAKRSQAKRRNETRDKSLTRSRMSRM
jgi:hypothetical protein